MILVMMWDRTFQAIIGLLFSDDVENFILWRLIVGYIVEGEIFVFRRALQNNGVFEIGVELYAWSSLFAGKQRPEN
jgi:hypothetical protein